MDQIEDERSVPYCKDGNTEVDIALDDTKSVSATAAGEKKSGIKYSEAEMGCSTPNTAAEPEVDTQKQQPQQRSAVDGDIPYELPRKESVDYDDVGETTEDQPPPEGTDADVNGCRSQAALSEPTVTPAADLNDNSNSDNAGMIRRSSSTQDVKPSECLADTGVENDGEEKDTGDKGETTGRDQQDGLRKALVGFYSVHNPERIENLDVILKQYAGKEDLLIGRLEQKYSADLSYARRASGMSERYPPGDVPPRADPSSGGAPAPRQPRPVRYSHHLYSTGNMTMPGRETAVATSGATLGMHQTSRGAADGHTAAVAHSGGSSSAVPSPNYMAYLADQIRYNVEGFLPASSGGGGGGGSTSNAGRSWALGRMTSPTRVATAAAGQRRYRDAADRPANAPAVSIHSPGLSATPAADLRPLSRPTNSRYSASVGQGARASAAFSIPSDKISERGEGLEEVGETDVVGGGSMGGVGSRHQEVPDPVLLSRMKLLEEERVGLMSAYRRLQSKADAAAREAAATEELRDAGQRKIAGFAERAAVSERQARDAVARLRSLEASQAVLQAEKEKAVRRCAAKHTQLLSAIDVQASLRSQLEGLLGVIPPTLHSALTAQTNVQPREGGRQSDVAASAACITTVVLGTDENRAGEMATPAEGNVSEISGEKGDDDGGGGDESAGGGVDELKRRCAALGVSLRASRREALEARRARDAAESMVREQRETLTTLEGTVFELKEALEKEKEARQIAARAVSGLESELDLQLSSLRSAEAKLSDRDDENARLKEELRGASARLQNASAARAALLSFCRQERTAVEVVAAEHVSRAEESAAMRGEEGLAKGLELADMAIEAGEKKAAALEEEIDRLGKALFDARAELAGSEARVQAHRRELGRAAETIAELSSKNDRGVLGDVGATGKEVEESAALDGETEGGESKMSGISPRAARSGKLAALDSSGGGARVMGDADVGAAIKAAVAAATATPPPEEIIVPSMGSAGPSGVEALATPDSFWMCAGGGFGRAKPSTAKLTGKHPAEYDFGLL